MRFSISLIALSLISATSVLGYSTSDSSSLSNTGKIVKGTSEQLQNSGAQQKIREVQDKAAALTNPLGGTTTDTESQTNPDTASKTTKQKRNKDAHDEPDEEEPDEEEPDEDEPNEHGGEKKLSVDGKRKEA